MSRLLLSSVAVLVATLFAVLLGTGSFALWNDANALNAGSVLSGTMQLTVNSGSTVALSGTSWSTLLPGDSVSQQVTLQNTGSVEMAVTALTNGTVGSLLVHVKKGTCGTAITGTSSTVSATALGTFVGGESSVACIQVSLPTSTLNTQQGTAQSFTVTFTGTTGA